MVCSRKHKDVKEFGMLGSKSWCRVPAVWVREGRGVRDKDWECVEGQILRGLAGHPTWSLDWRPMRADSQLPPVVKASRQEITMSTYIVFLSFL